MNRLARLITQAGHLFADRTAVIHGDRETTFAEIESLSNRVASSLQSLGLQKGDRVAILLSNRPEYVAIDFALMKAGLVRVPLNPRLAPEELEYIIRDCGARVVFLEDRYLDVIDGIRGELPDVEEFVAVDGRSSWTSPLEELLERGAPDAFEVPTDDTDPYMILYTSGTTGRPKGAVTNVRSRWVTIFHVYANETFITPNDVMLHVASLAHGSGTKVLPTYVKGAANVFLPEFDMPAFCDAVETHRVTMTWMVPTLVGMLLDFPDRSRYDLSSLQTVIYAGAPMPEERLREALEAFGPIFVQVYGLSEAPQPDLVLAKEDHLLEGTPEQLARLGSAGRPALGAQVRVVAEDGRDVAPGELGEILLAGEHILTEYWNRPGATAEVLEDGWFRTGDLARVDDEGYVFIVDRVKDMIISGGYNVYPREVEEVLYRHTAVRECAVIGVPDDKWGEAVRAVVSVRNGEDVTADDLIDHCRQHLAGYKKPKAVDFLPDLPKSPNGKILKKALRKPYWEDRSRQV